MRNNRILSGGLLVVFAAVLAAVMSSRSESAPEESAEGKTAREILLQRQAVLEQIVEISIADHRNGLGDSSSVIRARITLLESKRDLAQTAEERIAALQKIVQMTRQREQFADQRYRRGDATQVDVLESQAVRLKAEAALVAAQDGQRQAH